MAMTQRQVPAPETVPQQVSGGDYVTALAAFNWDVPERYAPGVTYLYVPAEKVREHKERGWSSANHEQLFKWKGGSVEFVLLKKGVPLPGIHRHQMLPDIRVYVTGEKSAITVSSELEIHEDH
jgi:hypothetical protein